jgi:hypothetical protein
MAIRSTDFRVKSVEKFEKFCHWLELIPLVLETDPDGSGRCMFFAPDMDEPPFEYANLEDGGVPVPVDFDEELKRLVEPGTELKYEVVYAVCIERNGEVLIEEPIYTELEEFLNGNK